MENFIEIKDLQYDVSNRRIFNGINIQIPKGKITAIMGPSGVGKTTLLRLIGAQLRPERGSIFLEGQNIHRLSRRQLFQLRKKMGLLFQVGGLFTHLTVFENVAFPLREHTKLPEAMIRDLVLIKLEMVGLRGAKDLMPHQLSGGMARRVALARAIALDPKLIMYDEPFTGQDPISLGVLAKLIRTLNDALGLTTIIVSHDVKETLQIADFVYVISDGKLIGQGSAANMQDDFKNAVVEVNQLQQFLQGLPDGPVPFHYPAISLENDLLGIQS